MTFPERFQNLPEYAFPRLRSLLGDLKPGGEPIQMTIGEPRHPFPAWVTQIIADHADGFGRYPPNDGTPELLDAMSAWLGRRYGVPVGPDRVMALNGTREGLMNTLIALCPEQKAGGTPVVLVPNPFYQVYAVAALTVGAQPRYVPATAATGFLPDYAALPRDVLDRTAIAWICSPANPQGAVASRDYLRTLIGLAEKHDFRILADECYSVIWRTAPPPGILEVAHQMGADPERIVAFHSLSKRSNLPGLRCGLVTAGPQSMVRIRKLRAYAGAPLPLPLQRAAEKVWADEAHVTANRALYAEKFAVADQVFQGHQGCAAPEGGFFLWLPVDDDEAATVRLWTETGVKVLPGSYLSREVDGFNPGKGYVRVALVAQKDEVQRGLTRLRDCLMT
jgi:N-succinyldiaminopimelate aminotransferase